MTNLFDWQQQEAAEAADDAIERVEANADSAWVEQAREAVYWLACKYPELTAEMLWSETGLAKPREPRALGAVFRYAAVKRWIEGTDRYRKSGNTVNHNRPQRVWASLLKNEVAA